MVRVKSKPRHRDDIERRRKRRELREKLPPVFLMHVWMVRPDAPFRFEWEPVLNLDH